MAQRAKPIKGSPFSIRLSKPTELYVEAEARRARRSKSAIVEDLTEEAARMRRFPGIEFRTAGDGGRCAYITGSGFYVWLLMQAVQDSGAIDDLVDSHGLLTKRHVELGLAYYREYPTEINEAIADNRRAVDERRNLYPFILVEYVDTSS